MKKKTLYPAIFIGFSLLATMLGTYFYQTFFAPNLVLAQDRASFYVFPGDGIEQVAERLRQQRLLEDLMSFRFVSRALKYDLAVKPGHYVLTKRMSNIEAVRLLRSGAQVPVRITFNNARTSADLAKKLCATLLADEQAFLAKLNDNAYLAPHGFDSLTVPGMFLPNTYEMYWTATEDELFERMKREYERFWTPERKAKAEALGLTPQQVAALASIVQGETQMADEKPRVAGVYLNRLKRGMLLQADPTVVFANQDFTIKRVLHRHLEIDSPYNTYKYAGLPPGPINVPTAGSIDAVLDYERHDYLFFCAKEDFSGYHNFATTNAQHARNAEKYRRALSARGIRG
jgi:UPF0755 protein